MKLAPITDADAGELPPDVRELRRYIRRNISAAGRLRLGLRRYHVRLENLSEQGCQIWLPISLGLAPGTALSLHIDRMGPFDATVRWQRDGWAGIEFDLPVYPPVLAHIHDHFGETEQAD